MFRGFVPLGLLFVWAKENSDVIFCASISLERCVCSFMAGLEHMRKGAVQFTEETFRRFLPKQLAKRSFKGPRQVTALVFKAFKTLDGLRFS
jgi:hypothetical protein